MQVKKQQLEMNIGKGVRQGYILSPYLLNLYVEYIIQNAKLEWSTGWN